MADLASSDITVTISERRIVGKKRRNYVTITFGDGAKTYPAGGVPMPAFSSFGMIRQLDHLNVLDDSAGTFLVKYDKANNKLRYYFPTGGTGTPAAASATAPIVSSGASTASAVDATTPTIKPGQAKEFVSATTTIAAQTLVCEAVGW